MQKRERLNEKILIAMDALHNSKGSFMGIFLMAFMIGVSLKESPTGYICYCMTAYAFYGILSTLFMHLLAAHPLASWRIGIFSSIINILAVILVDPNWPFFPLLIGLLTAVESQLFHRPREFLQVREIPSDRRTKFTSARNICAQIAKIVMPFVLGIVISETSFERTAIIVLAISTVQLILSFMLKPHSEIKVKTHTRREVLKYAVGHTEIRHALWVLLACGIALSGCAYDIVTQLNIYNADSSSVSLGSIQSISSIAAIIIILVYRHLRTKKKTGRDALVYALLPASILLPITAILFPGNFIIAAVLFVYFRAVMSALFCNTIFDIYYENALQKSIHDDAYRMEINILGELWLCIGRVLSTAPLLFLLLIGRDDLTLPLIAIQSLAVPAIIIAIRKSETSRAQGKL